VGSRAGGFSFDVVGDGILFDVEADLGFGRHSRRFRQRAEFLVNVAERAIVQDRRFVGCELEQELCREAILVAPDRLVEGARFNSVNSGQVTIQDNTLVAERINKPGETSGWQAPDSESGPHWQAGRLPHDLPAHGKMEWAFCIVPFHYHCRMFILSYPVYPVSSEPPR